MKFLDALRANQSRLTRLAARQAAGEFGFLKIRMFTGPVGRIVVATQKLSRANHDRTLRANSASSHNGIIVADHRRKIKGIKNPPVGGLAS